MVCKVEPFCEWNVQVCLPHLRSEQREITFCRQKWQTSDKAGHTQTCRETGSGSTERTEKGKRWTRPMTHSATLGPLHRIGLISGAGVRAKYTPDEICNFFFRFAILRWNTPECKIERASEWANRASTWSCDARGISERLLRSSRRSDPPVKCWQQRLHHLPVWIPVHLRSKVFDTAVGSSSPSPTPLKVCGQLNMMQFEKWPLTKWMATLVDQCEWRCADEIKRGLNWVGGFSLHAAISSGCDTCG